MQQQIEKLKQEREKLTTEFQNSRTEYKSEIKRIDRAIRNFERGMNELNGSGNKPKRIKSSSVIEEILLESGPLHLKQLCEKLHERSIPMQYQSLSGLMQMYAKSGKKFVKVAPATFALIPEEPEKEEKPEAEKDLKAKTTKEGKTTKKDSVEEETVKETENAPDRTIIYDEETNTIVSEGEV